MSRLTTLAVAIGLSAVAGLTVRAQTPARPSFDVASINPATPITPAQIQSGNLRVGMNVNDARVDIAYFSLTDLLPVAFRVKPYQLSGPAWMSEQRFDIRATLPPGADREQVPEMLQTLLADRFGLVVHREARDMPVYELVVGKEGSKLLESEPEPSGAPEPPAADLVVGAGENQVRMSRNGANGMTVTTARTGTTRMTMGQNGSIQMEMSRVAIPDLCEMLTGFAGRPVIDRTGLKGTYQFTMEIPITEIASLVRLGGLGAAGSAVGGGFSTGAPAGSAAEPAGNAVFQAVQRLGLRLDSRRAPVDTVVVDRLEKNPTEN